MNAGTLVKVTGNNFNNVTDVTIGTDSSGQTLTEDTGVNCNQTPPNVTSGHYCIIDDGTGMEINPGSAVPSGSSVTITTAGGNTASNGSTPPVKYMVTPSGSSVVITPSTAQMVSSGATQAFTVTASSGYAVSNTVLGTCPAGSWIGSMYTTGAITDDCTVSFSAVPPTVITQNVSAVLFSFNDASTSGSIGTGNSVITITNTGTSPALNVASTSLPSGITESSNNCGSSLAVNGSCQIRFSTTITPNSSQTISIAGTNTTNVISLPIAPLSVRVYSPPVNPVPSTASLMLVSSCMSSELLAVTNNSASAVTSLTFNVSAFPSATVDTTYCPVSSLPAGKTCVIGIVAAGASVNTSGASILMGWGGASAQGAIFAGVEASGASLPVLSTPASAVTVYGGYVYQEDSTCNIVKIAAFQDQYTNGNGGDPNPAAGSVVWSTAASTRVPNPGTGTGTGAENFGLSGGQLNTTAIIYQAGTPLTSYAAGLCSQYSESSGGTNYAGWYLPWDDSSAAAGTTVTELAAMWQNLDQGLDLNGFNHVDLYWASTETSASLALGRNFITGAPSLHVKSHATAYIRCSRALTY